MSGYNSRFLYDQCTFDQNLKSTTEPCRYQLVADKYENENMTIKKGPCGGDLKKIGCKPCDTNSNANIEAKWETIGYRTDIESDLLAINRPNTRCADLKYHPCGSGCTKKYCAKKCPNYVVVNTIVCDRHIVPTNNKMPTTTGFEPLRK
jgi:hypothetical protein